MVRPSGAHAIEKFSNEDRRAVGKLCVCVDISFSRTIPTQYRRISDFRRSKKKNTQKFKPRFSLSRYRSFETLIYI